MQACRHVGCEGEGQNLRSIGEPGTHIAPLMTMKCALVSWCLRGGATAGDPVVRGNLAHDVVAQIWRLVHDISPLGRHRVVLFSLK